MKKTLFCFLLSIFLIGISLFTIGCEHGEKVLYSLSLEYDVNECTVDVGLTVNGCSQYGEPLFEYHEQAYITVMPNEGYVIKYYFRAAEYSTVRGYESIQTYPLTDSFPVTQKCTLIIVCMPEPQEN